MIANVAGINANSANDKISANVWLSGKLEVASFIRENVAFGHMPTKKQAKIKDTAAEQPIPFDEVVKRLLQAPPQHKVAKKKPRNKK